MSHHSLLSFASSIAVTTNPAGLCLPLECYFLPVKGSTAKSSHSMTRYDFWAVNNVVKQFVPGLRATVHRGLFCIFFQLAPHIFLNLKCTRQILQTINIQSQFCRVIQRRFLSNSGVVLSRLIILTQTAKHCVNYKMDECLMEGKHDEAILSQAKASLQTRLYDKADLDLGPTSNRATEPKNSYWGEKKTRGRCTL